MGPIRPKEEAIPTPDRLTDAAIVAVPGMPAMPRDPKADDDDSHDNHAEIHGRTGEVADVDDEQGWKDTGTALHTGCRAKTGDKTGCSLIDT